VTRANDGPRALSRCRFMASTAVAGGAATTLGISGADATATAPGPAGRPGGAS
jgi:hypothetical protein